MQMENFAPIMFVGLVFVMLIGFPVAFSLAALGGVPVRINDPGCVGKTFPDYFQVLAGISGK